MPRFIDELDYELPLENTGTYLIGDFILDVCTHRDTECLQCTGDHGRHQLIDQATRTAAISASTIDLIFTSYLENLVNTGVTPFDITDHDLVYCVKRRISPKLPPKYVKSRNWNNIDETQFQDVCANFPLNYKTMDSAWDVFKSVLV